MAPEYERAKIVHVSDGAATVIGKYARYQGSVMDLKKEKRNSMVLVRKRTIPTERPPLVGEVIANF
jgi:hypothetical protein